MQPPCFSSCMGFFFFFAWESVRRNQLCVCVHALNPDPFGRTMNHNLCMCRNKRRGIRSGPSIQYPLGDPLKLKPN